MIGDFVVNDMVAVTHPTQPEDLAIGKVIHVKFGTNELSIEIWGSGSKNLLTAALKPQYFDPQDGTSLYIDKPLGRHAPAISLFSLAGV